MIGKRKKKEKLDFLIIAPSVRLSRGHAQVAAAITAPLRQWSPVVYLAWVTYL